MAKKREGQTTIQIEDKVWKQLNDYKINNRESFNKVIKRVILNKSGGKEEDGNTGNN